jgi:hypothetical protein
VAACLFVVFAVRADSFVWGFPMFGFALEAAGYSKISLRMVSQATP